MFAIIQTRGLLTFKARRKAILNFRHYPLSCGLRDASEGIISPSQRRSKEPDSLLVKAWVRRLGLRELSTLVSAALRPGHCGQEVPSVPSSFPEASVDKRTW